MIQRIAFYAPMKSPLHPTPSGDQRIAQLFIKALQDAGYGIELASELRSWEGAGLCEQQKAIKSRSCTEAEVLIADYQSRPKTERPNFWFTYHLYHKAPDWLGPMVAERLGIPYIVAECSLANKQRGGPWHTGWEVSVDAIKRADALIALNPEDIEGLTSIVPESKVHYLPPFVELTPENQVSREMIAGKIGLKLDKPWLITVAMMRQGDKFASYKILAEALTLLSKTEWQLVVIGGGQQAQLTQQLFSSVAENVFFVDAIEQAKIHSWLPCFDLFVWPAVNEAIGMAMLEALASGVPVLAGSTPGLSSLANECPGLLVVDDKRPECFSEVLAGLLDDQEQLHDLGRQTATLMAQRSSVSSAGRQLRSILEQQL